MRKLITAIALLVSTSAFAHGPHPVYPSRGYHHNDWIAPMIAGGIITYALTRPAPPVIVQQPVPVTVYPPVSQPPYPPYGYHYENMWDGYCSCYRLVLVQN